jgi:glycosyltransferase involved in cell wall biosynthesis
MLIIVQIPCLNEETTIGGLIGEIPRTIAGVDRVEVLVIDDGSTDGSVAAARAAGAEHVVSFGKNRGLARAFDAGLDAALSLGADVIVNIDADGQYQAEDIPRLVAPILAGEAEVVVGDRGIAADAGYPALKKSLQVAGSWTVRRLSGAEVADAASGFRAWSREAALRVHLVSDFTYTLESLIQAGKDRLKVVSVPVSTRPTARPSRLFDSIPQYLAKSAATLVRIYAMYEPLKVFAGIGAALFGAGFIIGTWFLFYYFSAGGRGHVQLLIFAAVLLIIGFQVMMMALVADLVGMNRKLLRDALYRLKRLEYSSGAREIGAREIGAREIGARVPPPAQPLNSKTSKSRREP